MDKIVFFWVESCNNLDGLSVNFGGKHKFAFLDNSLSVEENEDFLDNFFDKQGIENVSVIVGKNASGKSSLLKALRYVYSEANPPRPDENASNYLLIIERDGEYLYYSNNNGIQLPTSNSVKIKKSEEQPPKQKLVFYAPSYDFYDKTGGWPWLKDTDVSSDTILKKDQEAASWWNVYDTHKMNEVYRQIVFLETENAELLKDIINLPTRLDIKFTLPVLKNKEGKAVTYFKQENPYINGGLVTEHFNDKFPQNKIPNLYKWLELMLNNSLLDEPESGKKNLQFCAIHYLINNLCFVLDRGGIIKGILQGWNQEVNPMLKDLPDVAIEKFESRPDFIIKTLSDQFDLFAQAINHIIYSQILIRFKNSILQAIDRWEYDERVDEYSYFYIDVKDEALTSLINSYKDYLDEIERKRVNRQEIFSPHFLSFDWRAICTGERAFLNLFARMNHAKEELEREEEVGDSILILIDEGELGFHLEWQKKYMKILLDTLPLIFKFEDEAPQKIQIILTTHSPVSLSDIPRANVIYLKGGKVIDIKEPTFGANIHSLYKHSFFLEGMPIGEFAKEKIQKLFEKLQGNDSFSIEELTKIKKQIQMIGEPLLKNELMKLYNEKCNIEERIAELEKEIAKLKRQQEQ